MRKNWIKSLLVMIMAVLLVVTLVACNDKPNEPNKPSDGTGGEPTVPGQIATSEYFNKLWELTSDIGGTAISSTANETLAVHFGVVLDLATRNQGGNIVQQMDLGLDIQGIVGRKPETSNDTALKVRMYDPTDSENDEIATLYLFANDLDNIYIDFAGKNIKVPHGAATYIWKELLGNDTDLGDVLAGENLGLNYPLFVPKDSEDGEKQSINDIINDFVGDFGPNWTLNTLLNKVVKMVGLDLRALIEEYGETLATFLGDISADDLLDADGNVNLLVILQNNMLGSLLPSTKTTEGNVNTYKATVDSLLVGVIKNVLGNAGVLLNNDSEVALIFTEKDETLDSFSLFARLDGLKTRLNLTTEVIPEVKLTITDLSIEKHNASNGFTFEKGKYSDKIAVSEKLTFEMNGATLKEIEGFNKTAVELDGKVEVTLLGQLDVINETDNQTKLNLFVDFKNGDKAIERIATASYANGVLAGKLEGSLANGVTIGETTYKSFSANLDINVATEFKSLLKNIVDGFKKGDDNQGEVEGGEENGGATTAAAKPTVDKNGEYFVKDGAAFTFANWLSAIKEVLKLMTTDNNIQLSTSNALQTVVNVANCFSSGIYNDGKETIYFFKWSEKGRIEYLTGLLTNPPMTDDATFQDCLDVITGKNKDVKFMDGVLRMLYIVANAIEIDGVKVPQGGDAYVENIKAVLGAAVTIKGDVQKGVHLSVEATIGEATIKVTESLEVIDVKNDTFEIVTVDADAEGNFDLTETFNKWLHPDQGGNGENEGGSEEGGNTQE